MKITDPTIYSLIRDIRANIVRRYLSLSINRANKPDLSFDPKKIDPVIAQSPDNLVLWQSFRDYFTHLDPTQEHFGNHNLYKAIIDQLKEVELGKNDGLDIPPLLAQLTSGATKAGTEQNDESEQNDSKVDELQFIDISPLKEILLAIDNNQQPIESLLEAEAEIELLHNGLMQANYPLLAVALAEKLDDADADQKFESLVCFTDLYNGLEAGFRPNGEENLTETYRQYYLWEAYQELYEKIEEFIGRFQENPKFFSRKSTTRELESIFALLKTGVAFTLDGGLQSELASRNPSDREWHINFFTRFLSAHSNRSVISEEITEVAQAPLQEESITPPEQSGASLRHPYYLEGRREVTLKEAPDYGEDLVAELKESFQEEVAQEVFPAIEESLQQLTEAPYDNEVILTLRRAFHTLKGSGYMAGFMVVGEIGWQVEEVLNGCRDHKYEFSPAIWHHANDGYEAAKALLADELSHDEGIAHLERIAYQGHYLLTHDGVIEPQERAPIAEAIPTADSAPAAEETTTTTTLPHPYYLIGSLPVELKEAPDYGEDLIAELKESFAEEMSEEVFPTIETALEELFNDAPDFDKEQVDNLRRAFHTIKGSGFMAGHMVAGEMAWQVEELLNACRDHKFEFNDVLLHHSNDAFKGIKGVLSGELSEADGIKELERIAFQAKEIMDHRAQIEPQEMVQSVVQPSISTPILETSPASEIAPEVIEPSFEDHFGSEEVYKERPEENLFSENEQYTLAQYDLTALIKPLEELKEMLPQLRLGSYYDLQDFSRITGVLTNRSPLPSIIKEQQLISALHYNSLMHRAHGISPREQTLELWEKVLNEIEALTEFKGQLREELIDEQVKALKRPIITYGASAIEESDESNEEQELYELFKEEAIEILEITDELINDWRDDGYNEHSELIAEFRRHMHTLKGSARMVDRNDIGQLAHAMESLLDPLYISRFNSDPKQFEVLQRTLDYLPLMLERSTKTLNEEGYSLLSALHLLLGNETPPELDIEGNIEGDQKLTKVTEETSTAAQAELSAIRVSPVRLANISEDVAENMILATQQERTLGQLNTALDELERTISRVNMQTRRIEIEMEAQMLSRHARVAEDDDFDPLELDRFTELQQVTRFISESVSDLYSLRETLQEQVEELSAVSDKQHTLNDYINTALNEIRTVSFLNIIPRLRRLIRQVGKEHDKRVELITEGVDIQVERSIVEQMVAPFEHMIRNSIVHGLEPTEERISANKAPTGKITLEVVKQDAELLIRFSDDGKGIDIEKVRAKAIDMGVIQADQPVEDQELVEMLMLPGMSTATSLSQDAGRGVGLDVFAKAILLLNAKFQIINRPNEGLTFEIRVPFALSTIKSLIVKAGHKHYAIPLNHVVAVDNQQKVDDYEYIHYQGQKYLNYKLSSIYRDISIFTSGSESNLHILLNVNGVRYALEVDEIDSQEEIIMRPLNPQIAATPGLSGASVLSDGEIVYILDVAKVFDSVLTEEGAFNEHEFELLSNEFIREASKEVAPKVLVVDDSITMRRVSSRLVEKLGLRYETAKDGLDAIEKVEIDAPDLIMLDIEMPNMDGFEVLSYLKSHEAYHHIPIIMITSRIGEKHKERALELGASMYCGKPYTEDEMNANIKQLLSHKWDKFDN